MDSMRSLNTSLPRTSPHRQTASQPPEALLSAFKAAALSVTNLFKTAASDQARARAAGYQDALDDLLTLMDKENLGVQDGEGWRIRQWATERFDGQTTGKADSDEEDAEEEDTKARSSSPEITRKTTTTAVTESAQSEPELPTQPEQTSQPHHRSQTVEMTLPSSDTFNFRSSHAYPNTNHDAEMETSTVTVPAESATTFTVSSRPSRKHHNRNNGNNNNNNNASSRSLPSTINLGSLGSGAGSKRKNNFNDFFNIPDFQFGNGGHWRKDDDRPGKRGRHI